MQSLLPSLRRAFSCRSRWTHAHPAIETGEFPETLEAEFPSCDTRSGPEPCIHSDGSITAGSTVIERPIEPEAVDPIPASAVPAAQLDTLDHWLHRAPCFIRTRILFSTSLAMGFEVEVVAGRSQRFYDIAASNLHSLEQIFLTHSETTTLAISVNYVSSIKPKALYDVNLSTFRCLKRLTHLEIEMNDVATLRCDNPFLFRLKRLSLAKCQMTLYNFCILMNCVADTLESLDLMSVSLLDGRVGEHMATMLRELNRLSKLKSIKVDRTWLEYHKDSVNLNAPRLESLAVLKVDLEDLFSPALRKTTACLVTQTISVDGTDYRLGDLDALMKKVHEFAASSWSSMKFGIKRRGRRTYDKNIDATTKFSVVLGWPRVDLGDSLEDVSKRLKRVFATDNLTIFVPGGGQQLFPPPSPCYSASSSPALSPVSSNADSMDANSEVFVTAFDSLTQISAAS